MLQTWSHIFQPVLYLIIAVFVAGLFKGLFWKRWRAQFPDDEGNPGNTFSYTKVEDEMYVWWGITFLFSAFWIFTLPTLVVVFLGWKLLGVVGVSLVGTIDRVAAKVERLKE